MAGSQEDIITDLLKDSFPDEVDLRDAVARVLSSGMDVPRLLALSMGLLERFANDLFPAESSLRTKWRFLSAIDRRKEAMHDSSSGTPNEMDEKTAKRVAELLDEKIAKRVAVDERIVNRLDVLVGEMEAEKKSKKSLKISCINSQQWMALERAVDCRVTLGSIGYTPTHISDLPAFDWDDRVERAQSDRYLPHLNSIRKAPKWTMIDAAKNEPNLLTGWLADYTIGGTADVAVVHVDGGMMHSNVCLRCIFELKKSNVPKGKIQTLVSLLMAHSFSDGFRPFAVLTDLINDWFLYWVEGSRICYIKCESSAVAVGIVEDLLGEDQDFAPSSGLPFLRTVGPGERDSLIARNSKRPSYTPPGAENIEDLEGCIPHEEILEARVDAGIRHIQRMLQSAELREEDPVPEGWYL